MADVQNLFERFHTTIRTYYEINEKLRSKKTIIVNRIQEHLKENDRPACQEYIQGSYKMKVGILALEGSEYDIDVGLRFSFDEKKYTPSTVREWVFDAVKNHTADVKERGPCIRVTYSDGYHVDLVCYAWWDDEFGAEQHRLAHKTSGWRPANPPKLVQYVRDARRSFEGTEDSSTQTDQFRRVVRYLKRWNDNAIRGESDEKPSGLALVLLTKQHLTGPALTLDGSPDDRLAVELVARAAAETVGRISAIKPTPEGEDMFGRLSEKGMRELKERFGVLRDALIDAQREPDASKACKRLKDVFGDDFPCTNAGKGQSEEALRTSTPAVVPSSSSA
jgi:hypothetical protein